MLSAYSDVDWVRNHDDQTSTTAYIVYLYGNLISWFSHKQKSITYSSIRFEYCVMATIAVELSWMQYLLGKLGVSLLKPLVIHCDNVGATYLCVKKIFHFGMKHIYIDFHFM